MSSGQFRGVIHGTWETTGNLPVLPVLAVAMVAAFIAWLMTVLWLVAAMLGVLLTLSLGGLVVIRRYNRRETGRFIGRMGALADMPRPVIAATAAPAEVHYHTHLHIEPGTGAEALVRQMTPVRDVITVTEEN